MRANTKVKKEKEATKKRAATASESPKKKPKKEKAAPAKKKEKAPAKKKAAPVKKDAKKAKASAEEKDGPRKISIQLSQVRSPPSPFLSRLRKLRVELNHVLLGGQPNFLDQVP